MRTPIDLPDDLYRIASSIARDTGASLSETVADLVRRGLGDAARSTVAVSPVAVSPVAVSPVTGLPVIRLGRTITVEDVRALDDGSVPTGG